MRENDQIQADKEENELSLSGIDHAERIRQNGFNVYFVAEGDRGERSESKRRFQTDPACNCYSIAKVFTVTTTGRYSRTEDVVKPEILYLNRGLRQGRRVISEERIGTVGFGLIESADDSRLHLAVKKSGEWIGPFSPSMFS